MTGDEVAEGKPEKVLLKSSRSRGTLTRLPLPEPGTTHGRPASSRSSKKAQQTLNCWYTSSFISKAVPFDIRISSLALDLSRQESVTRCHRAFSHLGRIGTLPQRPFYPPKRGTSFMSVCAQDGCLLLLHRSRKPHL